MCIQNVMLLFILYYTIWRALFSQISVGYLNPCINILIYLCLSVVYIYVCYVVCE